MPAGRRDRPVKAEVERLLEGLGELREDRRSIGPHHPKFVEWVGAVRQCLEHRGDRAALDRFERLRVARSANGMWRREVLSGLDEVEGLLRTLAAAEPPIPAKNPSPSGREPGRRTCAAGRPVVSSPPAPEATVTQSPDPIPRPSPQPGRFKAMEVLLGDLGEELKRPDGDLGKIQKMMGDLLDLKKTGDLVERALSASAEPGARWEAVRAPLAQLWAASREIVLDLLPALLKKP